MKIVPRKMPATTVGLFLAVILVSSAFLFDVDIIEMEIKFLQGIEKHHLDNIIFGLIVILVGIAIDRATEFKRSAKAIQEPQWHLEKAVLQFVETMAQALDARDKYTAGHSNRVSANSTAIAEAMQLARKEVQMIRIGARLHDIGKIRIPELVE